MRPPPRTWLMIASCAVALAAGCAPALEPEPGKYARRIIGGTETSAYPAVMLVLAQVPGSKFASICTGTLVSPHVVLTAAHCLDPSLIGATAELSVFVGTNIDAAAAGDFLPTRARHFHPDFRNDQFTSGGDIGVVVLTDARSGEVMALNRSALSSGLIGQAATLVGYGKNDGADPEGLSAGRKREVTTQMGAFTDRIVRFGEPGKTSCEGDSGGPGLMSIEGRTVVVGVVSFGSPVCDQIAYDTRVDAYTDWLDSYIEEADPGFLAAQGVMPHEGGCALAGGGARSEGLWIALLGLLCACTCKARRAPLFRTKSSSSVRPA